MASSQFDAILANGQVGAQAAVADGTPRALRLDKTGALIVATAHGQFHEAASRGKLFIASIGVAGVAPGTALSTSPALTLWNPSSSNIVISVKQAYVGYVSGTLGAGMLVFSQNASQVAAPTGGTELTPVCSLLNQSRGTGRAFTGSTISATSTLVRPSMSMGAALASSVAFPGLAEDFVDGGIVIPAGVALCYQGIAAGGSTPLLSLALVYEEITLP